MKEREHLLSEFKQMVRILRTDIDGNLKAIIGLTRIKGVGFAFADALLKKLNIDKDKKIGDLTEKQIKEIEDSLKDASSLNLPSWLVNRRKDLATGLNLHLVGSDLDITVKRDIDRLYKTRSWRGIRHSLGLKVRGQRTRTTGRRGVTVGVKKKRAR